LGKPLYTPKFILDVNILKNGFCVVWLWIFVVKYNLVFYKKKYIFDGVFVWRIELDHRGEWRVLYDCVLNMCTSNVSTLCLWSYMRSLNMKYTYKRYFNEWWTVYL
jgi:hypothetical protein